MLFVLAAAVIAAAAPAAPTTMQGMFDAASAAAENGHCTDAVRDFDIIAARPGVRRNPAVTATIAVRKGKCLVTLGRLDDAETALRDGLAGLPADGVYRNDLAVAHMALGRIAYLRFDYAGAKREFLAARDLLPPDERFEVLIDLVRATMFDDDDEALSDANAALALAAAPGTSPSLLADVRTLHARVLLNHGEPAKAYAELKQALAAEGGLTLKVNAAKIITRSDLALAALLTKDFDGAREYLAYTGAGHAETPFAHAASMQPPPCEEGLMPDDSAIVEFGINDDGSVGYATPVYVSRLGAPALAFARAVAGWSWRPEAAAKLGPLFRAVTRVELRCSTASASPGILDTLRSGVGRWLTSRGVAQFDTTGSDMAIVARARAAVAKAGPSDIAAIRPLMAIERSDVLAADVRRAAAVKARDIAVAERAPVPVRTYFEIRSIDDLARDDASARKRAALRALLADPTLAADAPSRSVLRLAITEQNYRTAAPPDAAALLTAVADDPDLPAGDPLRANARLRLASLQARAGNLDAARASYALSGVSAQQCALVDAKPALRSANVSDHEFPNEALRWGFEGWVELEFDVTADGHTDRQRAIIAYPPQVFRDAAIGTAKNFRYQQSFRPNGIAGCGGAQQVVNFKIARR